MVKRARREEDHLNIRHCLGSCLYNSLVTEEANTDDWEDAVDFNVNVLEDTKQTQEMLR
jgi:hypothetical protein